MSDIKGLIVRAWEVLKSGDRDGAEQLFIVATEQDPEEADGWNGLGAVYFEAGDLSTSLGYYMKAREIETVRQGGTLPERLHWDGSGRIALRALYGIALNLFRMGRSEEAEKVFRELLARNPDDNQGVRYMLDEIEKGSAPWSESSSKDI